MKVKGRNICYANHWRRKNNKIVGEGGWVWEEKNGFGPLFWPMIGSTHQQMHGSRRHRCRKCKQKYSREVATSQLIIETNVSSDSSYNIWSRSCDDFGCYCRDLWRHRSAKRKEGFHKIIVNRFFQAPVNENVTGKERDDGEVEAARLQHQERVGECGGRCGRHEAHGEHEAGVQARPHLAHHLPQREPIHSLLNVL